jgi:uncharacterized lipoprotein YmbA
MRTLIRPLLLLAAAGALTACAGAQTRFYTLRPGATPAAPLVYAGPAFRLDAVHIPPSLDRAELVRDGEGDRVVVSDNDHWAGPLGELLRRVLTQDLAARLPTGKVIFPDAPKPPGSSGLVVDVLSLSARGGTVTMQASWTLLPGTARTASGSPPPLHQRSIQLTTSSLGGVKGNADELSALADQLSDAIAKDLSGGV